MDVLITTFYKFTPIAPHQFDSLKQRLLNEATDLDLRGLLLVGVEGLNGTLSGSEVAITHYKNLILSLCEKSLREDNFREESLREELIFKDSWSHKHPFHDMKVKTKKEIVSLHRPDLVPGDKNLHLSPKEWHRALKEKDVILLDVRNQYETKMGHFKNAIDPQIHEFNEFPHYLKNSNLSKNKKVLMYCTGGIRCEKALLLAQEQGYKNVYQLDGGIINYLKEFPRNPEGFQGECFVFDYRVALDQHLKPSQKYRLCPHCGDPGHQRIHCLQCHREDIVCTDCFRKSQDKSRELRTCSKNCAHHFKMGHKTCRPHLDGHKKRVVLQPKEHGPTTQESTVQKLKNSITQGVATPKDKGVAAPKDKNVYSLS